MRFRPKTKRAIALTAAAVLTATAILPQVDRPEALLDGHTSRNGREPAMAQKDLF